MALIKWRKEGYDPFRELWQIQDEINRLFSRSLSKENEVFTAPALDISEEKDKYVVKADLPGLKQKDISVEVDNDILSISGEKRSEIEDKTKNFLRIERSYGKFQRSVSLPKNVDPEKIDAKFQDGVLELVIPKNEIKDNGRKRIEVK